MIKLSRGEVLKGNYKFPLELVRLKPSLHFKKSLENRGLELDCIPSMVRVSRDNIHSAKTIDNIHLTSVVIRLSYTSCKYMFICLNPYDGAGKTIWFKRKERV